MSLSGYFSGDLEFITFIRNLDFIKFYFFKIYREHNKKYYFNCSLIATKKEGKNDR